MEIRRIGSEAEKQAEEERKKRRNKYLGIGLLVIMTISSLGYAFISGDEDSDEKDAPRGDGIFEQNGQWIARYGQINLVFNTDPEEAKNVSSDINLNMNNFTQGKVYVADKEGVLIGILTQSIGKYASINEACYGVCAEDLPEKNCSGPDYLIIWNRTAENALWESGNCIFIDGDIKAVDAFVYRAFVLI